MIQDGCSAGLDPAHIRGFGATGIDTLENVITLCRKHHNQHEDGQIEDLTLQLILYQLYGYGPDEWLVDILEAIKDFAERMGYTVTCRSETGLAIDFNVRSLGRTTAFALTVSFMETVCTDVVLKTAYDYIMATRHATTD